MPSASGPGLTIEDMGPCNNETPDPCQDNTHVHERRIHTQVSNSQACRSLGGILSRHLIRIGIRQTRSGVLGEVANYINFFQTACHRPAAACGLADPDVVQNVGRRSRSKSRTKDPGRRAGPKVPDEERKRIQARLSRPRRTLPLSPEIVKLF